jgi:hypothetical protein
MIVKLEDNYFSDTLKWTIIIGSALVSGYLTFIANYQWVGFILLIISLISFSTKYVLEIDTEKKFIIDSFYLLWIKTKSEEVKFNTLNCIRLDKQRHIYNSSSRSRDGQTDFNEYIGTLEYDHNKSVELVRTVEYQSMAEEMKGIAERLSIPINRTF